MIVIVIVITHRLFDLHEARSHAERLRDEYVRNASPPPTASAPHFVCAWARASCSAFL